MTLRPCLDCGLPAQMPPGIYRCRPCEQRRQQRRNLTRTQYRGPWRTLSRAARAAQPWCTRCGKTATEVQLSLDHETGTVECVPCNASHRRDVPR